MRHTGEALRIRVKKFKQNLPENYSKSTKMAITACEFSKFFRGRMSPDPPNLELFLFLHQLQVCSAEKNLQLKKMWNSRYVTEPPDKLQEELNSP